jgi:chromosome segregation ATPase
MSDDLISIPERVLMVAEARAEAAEKRLAEAQDRIVDLCDKLTQAQTQGGQYREEALGYYDRIAQLEALVPEATELENVIDFAENPWVSNELRDAGLEASIDALRSLPAAIRAYREAGG